MDPRHHDPRPAPPHQGLFAPPAQPVPPTTASLPVPVGSLPPPPGANLGQPGPQTNGAGLVMLPKNPAIMVIASFLLSGLGSLLCGKTIAGLTFMAIEIVGTIMMLVLLIIPIIGWFLALLLAPVLFISWLAGMAHAYQSAQSWNRSLGVVA